MRTLITILLLFVFFGCQKSVPIILDIDKFGDKDRDGHKSAVDCNDSNPHTYPGAPEMGGDDIDNNCNGTKDERIVVEFTDMNLKSKIIETLGLKRTVDEDVYNNEVSELKSLFVNNSRIKNIKGLEYAHNITNVDLSENEIHDLTPLLANPGIKGREIYVNIDDNLLNEKSCPSIQKLVNKDIHIYYDTPCDIHIDMDNDKYWVENDCDDRDEFTSPGSPELGDDGKDNNCNGEIDEEEQVIFENEQLKEKVIKALKILNYNKNINDKIFNHEMSKLTYLKAADIENPVKLYNLKGLEYAYNLKTLIASFSDINDLSAIKGLKNLEYLELKFNDLKSISPLSRLKNLRKIILQRNEIFDISPLSELTALESVDLTQNSVYNISPLENLYNLKVLSLSSNEVNQISPLADLYKLEKLNLTDNNVLSIEPLKNLVNLSELSLSDNRLKSIDELANLRKLEHLSLADNRIESIPMLSGFPYLKILNLKNNQVKDISSISELLNLTHLFLENNQIREISPVSELINLEGLNLKDNLYIKDISPLEKLTKLSNLNLSNNEIEDISVIENLKRLRSLYLSNNQIYKIDAIEGLEWLYILKLNINNITDIQPLVNNSKINKHETVYLGNNPLDSGDCENLQILIDRGVKLYHNIPCGD